MPREGDKRFFKLFHYIYNTVIFFIEYIRGLLQSKCKDHSKMNTRIKLDNYVSIYGLINCITLSSYQQGNSFSTETFFGRRDGVAHLPDFKGLIGVEPNLCNQTVHFLNLQFRRTELCPWAQHTTKKYIVYSIFTTEKIVLLSHRFFAMNFRLFVFPRLF